MSCDFTLMPSDFTLMPSDFTLMPGDFTLMASDFTQRAPSMTLSGHAPDACESNFALDTCSTRLIQPRVG